MKRIILSLVMAFATIISAHAMCMNRTFTAYDEGEYFGKIVLTDNCECTISTVDGERFTGTYNISSNIDRGDQCQIVFYLSNGQTIKATYAWPVQGKKCILLDGFVFEASN